MRNIVSSSAFLHLQKEKDLNERLITLTQERFTLYSRERCPLCDKAKMVMEEFEADSGIGFQIIDIHSADDLVEKYGLMIPVLEWGTEIIQYGNIDRERLNQLFQKK
ncbi:glutaredoxin family protein [Bacillus sp. MUM 13]|uniref:glutaredoxin family protein n=1 Tax=Bacillus sp. MUM 13 TaxID=1678001 RepID=UPI001F0A179A|nr:glutaredoxin family protein [Bacillus sp. MUM 13]